MKSEIKKVIEKGLKNYRIKPIRVGGGEYNLSIFLEDEDINIFEGFLFAEAKDKSELANFKKYRAPVSGYTPRVGLIFYKDKFLIKDYRQKRHILKTIRKVNDTFLKKLKKALAEPKADTFNKLFDRTDIIEEFYILYKKSRDFLLDNIKGISDEEKRETFVDNFMLQMLTLWYLQEREFFDGDKSYFITKFNYLKQKKLTGDASSYYDFLRYFFDKISNSVDRQYINDDPTVGNVVVVGPAIFLNGRRDSESISIPEKCFYKDGVTETLIGTPPKKVSADVPLLNLFESRDWTEGDMDEFVLGALYEKLITEDVRKETGAYYTPEEITSYICKNTIEPYLVDRTNEKLHWNFESVAQVVDGADKKLLLFLFGELKNIKILDPAVGSAHFLESAIDVLLGVYERIWYRAKELKMGKGLVVKSSDEYGNVTDVELLEISSEEQFRLYVKFFIILSRNIYGVDINPGALKVAKARLFLTLAKHFDAAKNYFIRFPNVHFNLRDGNSLIGYAEIETPKGQTSFDMYVNEDDAVYMKESVKVVSRLGDYLPRTAKALGIGGDIVGEVKALNKILSKKTIDWYDFNTVLRTKEKLIKILIVSLNSEYARPLNELLYQITGLFNSKLDARFADEHGIDPDDLKTIQTFHWVFEFPEVFLDRGGFDVVVGNPPYVEINDTNYGFILNESKDLYDAFMRISINIIHRNGTFGFIHANSVYCQPKFNSLRRFLGNNTNDLIIINFAIRPQPVFKNVMQRTAITICKKDYSKLKTVRTSRYIRLTEENKSFLLATPPIYDSSDFALMFDDFIPKIGNEKDYEIFKKTMQNSDTINDIMDIEGVPIYYHDSGESYWTKALNVVPKGIRDGEEVRASQWFELKINPIYADFVLCIINSTLFYWFWLTISDCRHLTQKVIKQCPIPSKNALSSADLKKMNDLSTKLMTCYGNNSNHVEKRRGYKSLEFKVAPCKKIINEIDFLLGKMYGLTDDEINYIIKYDLEMKIGGV